MNENSNRIDYTSLRIAFEKFVWGILNQDVFGETKCQKFD